MKSDLKGIGGKLAYTEPCARAGVLYESPNLLDAAVVLWQLGDVVACLKAAIECLAGKNIDTPASSVVRAMTLVAVALDELGVPTQARMLSQTALVLARVQLLFDLLPTTLSCAARIESSNGSFARAEILHAEALECAKWSSSTGAVHGALEGLLMSHIDHLNAPSQHRDRAPFDQLKQSPHRVIAKARRLSLGSVPEWRRISFQVTLGELIGLCGDGKASEHLLRRSLDHSVAAGQMLSRQSSATALAALLEARGEFRAALELLSVHANADNPNRGSFRRRLQATRIAESCLKELGIGDEISNLSRQVEEDLGRWKSSRELAIQMLIDAGIVTRWVYSSADLG